MLFIDDDLADYLRGHYDSILIKPAKNNNSELQLEPANSSTTLFKDLVSHMLRIEENRVRRDELSQKSLSITRNRLTKWIAPYFDDMSIGVIGYVTLEAFIEGLTEAEIKGVAITQYLIIIRKVLKYALLTNLITSLPHFPKVKAPMASRGAFTITEYRRLLKTAWRLRNQPL